MPGYAAVLNRKFSRRTAAVRKVLGLVKMAREKVPAEKIHPSLQFTRLGAHLRDAAQEDSDVGHLARAAILQPHNQALDLLPFHALRDAMQENPEHPLAQAFNWHTLPDKLALDEVVRSEIDRANRSLPPTAERLGPYDLAVEPPERGYLRNAVLAVKRRVAGRYPDITEREFGGSFRRLLSQHNQSQRAAILGMSHTDQPAQKFIEQVHNELGDEDNEFGPRPAGDPMRYARTRLVAHPLVEGFPIETALRRLVNGNKSTGTVRDLAHAALVGGHSEALWGLHDALGESGHPWENLYNWRAAADKMHLDKVTHEALRDEAERVRHRTTAAGLDMPWGSTPERAAQVAAAHMEPRHPNAPYFGEPRTLATVRQGVKDVLPDVHPDQIDESIRRHAYRGIRRRDALFGIRHDPRPHTAPLGEPGTYPNEHDFLNHKATRYARPQRPGPFANLRGHPLGQNPDVVRTLYRLWKSTPQMGEAGRPVRALVEGIMRDPWRGTRYSALRARLQDVGHPYGNFPEWDQAAALVDRQRRVKDTVDWLRRAKRLDPVGLGNPSNPDLGGIADRVAAQVGGDVKRRDVLDHFRTFRLNPRQGAISPWAFDHQAKSFRRAGAMAEKPEERGQLPEAGVPEGPFKFRRGVRRYNRDADEQAFHRKLIYDTEPGDKTPHMVYMDWLEDNGLGHLANILRPEIESPKFPGTGVQRYSTTLGLHYPATYRSIGYAGNLHFGIAKPIQGSAILAVTPRESFSDKADADGLPFHYRVVLHPAAAHHLADTLPDDVRIPMKQALKAYHFPEPGKRYSRRRYAAPSNGSFLDALRRASSRQQRGLHEAAKTVVRKLGLAPAQVSSVVHDAPGRSTPGVATAVYGGWGNPEAVRSAASWLGLYTRSPGMGVFHVRPTGPDAIYRMRLFGAGNEIRARLDRSGIGQRLLIPHRRGFDVLVPDKGGGQYPAVRAFSEQQGIPMEMSRGHFQTIGASDPGDARAKFRGTIKGQEGNGSR